MEPQQPLSDAERTRYEWQLWVPGFGASGQERLKGASVLISRCGGVGGIVAYELAAAGVGRLVLAHAGNVRLNDLNRQLLMTTEWIGKPRVECAAGRLRELNPLVAVETVAENIREDNVAQLVGRVDLVVDLHRCLANGCCSTARSCGKTSHSWTVRCTIWKRSSRRLCPERRRAWLVCTRRSHLAGSASSRCSGRWPASSAASRRWRRSRCWRGLGEPLLGGMPLCDLRDMSFRQTHLKRRTDCAVCGHGAQECEIQVSARSGGFDK